MDKINDENTKVNDNGTEPEHKERHGIINNMNTDGTEKNLNNPDVIMPVVFDTNTEQTPKDSERRNKVPDESHAEIKRIELLTTSNIRLEDAATVTQENGDHPAKEVDDEKVVIEKTTSTSAKSKLCASKYRTEWSAEELLEQAEMHAADLANITSERDGAQDGLVTMSRLLSTRRRIEQIADSSSSEAEKDS